VHERGIIRRNKTNKGLLLARPQCRLALMRLSGSGWGAGATTLRIAALALVHSTAEYCAPVWCRSADTRLIDPAINDDLRIVTGCLRPTPGDNLPILGGIQPAGLLRNGATLSPARRAMEPRHLFNSLLARPSSANARRIKSRHPFVPAARTLISASGNNIRAAQWGDYQWNAGWADNSTRLRFFIPGTHPPGATLPRRTWVRLNRLRTGVGRFRSCLYKWGMTSSAACECDAEEQTADYVVLQCPIHRPPHGVHGLTVLDDETTEWLINICPEI